MKKFLLSFLFFLFTCASMWGATYNYNGGFKSCTISEITVGEQTQFTLSMDVRAKNSTNRHFSSKLTLILLSSDGTLDGDYSTNNDDNKITNATNLVYSNSTRYPYAEEVSTFTIAKIDAQDHGYRVTSGELHLTAGDDYYNYTFCYGVDGSDNVGDSKTSYDFTDIVTGSVTGTSTNKTLTISGRGAMSTYTSGTAPWYSERNNIKHIVILPGVTSIGNYAFEGISSSSADITVPVSCTSFGSNAFANCSTIVKIYYAGSPNQWAVIDFADETAHPFGALSGTADYYFYGDKSNKTNTLVFFPPLTQIKQYTFYRIYLYGSSNGLSIPGTVETIGDYAFYGCNIAGEIAINRKESPTMGEDAFRGIGTNRTLYVPSGATGYRTSGSYWYFNPTTQAVKGNSLDSYGTDIKWELEEDGTLTLDATSGSAAKTITYSASNQYKWRYFRRLVNKVVIKGDISELACTFTWLFGIAEIELDQSPVPTITTSEAKIPFGSRFDQSTNVVLKIKAASLLDASVSNLGSAPWNNAKLDIQLSDNVVLSDLADNSTLISNLQTYYAGKNFTLQFGRSLSNAYYNTFCSPIDMNSTLVESIFGAGTKIYSFAGTSYTEETDELSLNFNESQDYIEAGVPYLIWPANNVSNPSFTNVDPDDVATSAGNVPGTHATFYGTLAPVDVLSTQIDAKSFIFLQANNTLNWASEGTLYGMRAYWLLTGDVPARALARRPVMKIGQSTTAIGEVRSETANAARSEKIMRNGQLFIVRGEQMYNAQGQMIK